MQPTRPISSSSPPTSVSRSTSSPPSATRPQATPSASAVETVSAFFIALSDATAPKPRSKPASKELQPSESEALSELYGGASPPMLEYNAPPPAYDQLYGPDPTKPIGKRDAIKSIAKKVGRELVGGK
ncbi:hypothetical protein FRB94_011837 [Tulasnella sp. JGI-2019a]|nr:hypothetical protein FRB93_002284 [Tulasnella sp. JGI-2019a]KAG9014659.1 hypothetical protein FRB94_011837 [Tulasnella sp. JGI-2019a]